MSLIDLTSYRRVKAFEKYGQIKPIKKLTPEQMKSTAEKKKREYHESDSQRDN